MNTRPNLASHGLLVQLQSSDSGVRLVARVRQRVRRVDLPMPSITRRLWCLHRRRRPCNLVGRTWLPSVSARQLRASWRLLCPTARPWQLRSSKLWPTGRSWQLGASCLRPYSLLSPRGGAPPSCVPMSSSCACKPCNQKSRAKSS
jgi:hypothetical protein